MREKVDMMTENEIKASRPGNLAFEASRKKLFLELPALVVSGLLYACAFPPLNLSFVAWIALIPLYFIVRGKRPLKSFLYGFVWGYAFSCATYFWLREIEFFIPYGMAAVLAIFPALWCLLLPALRRYLFVPVEVQLKGYDEETEHIRTHKSGALRETYFVLVMACCWCVLEWVRTWLFTGFPWNLTAVTQWKNPAIIQICEFTGVYGVSFIIVFFNIALALSVNTYLKPCNPEKYKRPIPLIIALVLIMLSILTGSWSISREIKNKDNIILQAGVIQGDIPQCRAPTPEQADYALEKYLRLTEDLLRSSKPEIVIWPETAVPVPYRSGCKQGAEYRRRLSDLVISSKTPFLIGTVDFGDQPVMNRGEMEYPIHNSAMLIDSDGHISRRYHKMHLVPFGEYTPLGRFYPALIRYFGMGRSLTPGKHSTIFELKPGVYGAVNICFEDVFPEISMKHAAAGANLLIVLSNDAWYPKSSEPEQHLAHAVFRAVENRRPILRAGNNSGTCVINSSGVIIDSISVKPDPKTKQDIPDPEKKTEGVRVFQVKVPENPGLTFYTRYGNIFIYLCIVISISGILFITLSWKDKKDRLLAMRGSER